MKKNEMGGKFEKNTGMKNNKSEHEDQNHNILFLKASSRKAMFKFPTIKENRA